MPPALVADVAREAGVPVFNGLGGPLPPTRDAGGTAGHAEFQRQGARPPERSFRRRPDPGRPCGAKPPPAHRAARRGAATARSERLKAGAVAGQFTCSGSARARDRWMPWPNHPEFAARGGASASYREHAAGALWPRSTDALRAARAFTSASAGTSAAQAAGDRRSDSSPSTRPDASRTGLLATFSFGRTRRRVCARCARAQRAKNRQVVPMRCRPCSCRGRRSAEAAQPFVMRLTSALAKTAGAG